MHSDPLQEAKNVLQIEADAIRNLVTKIDDNFSKAVEIISRSKGRVIVTGIGKSGLIGKKIVATLTSTGTPALFLHPVEGLHGDLGIVTKDDVMLAISNSGETNELNMLIQKLQDLHVPLVAFTGNMHSTLGRYSDVIIDIGVEREACPFGLVPTSSSTATLAMGDALTVALIKEKEFNEKDFYKFHPGGQLGLRLMDKVKDAMICGNKIPTVPSQSPATMAIEEMDEKNLGFVLIVSADNRLLGILTDGDIRRLIRRGIRFSDRIVDDFMTRSPKTVDPETSLAETIEAMQRDEITTLAVVDGNDHLEGFIHLHDILGRGGTIQIAMPR
jgi:arabinose-5-phosphate isomerase